MGAHSNSSSTPPERYSCLVRKMQKPCFELAFVCSIAKGGFPAPKQKASLLDHLTAAARRSGGAQRHFKSQGGGAWEARRCLAACCVGGGNKAPGDYMLAHFLSFWNQR